MNPIQPVAFTAHGGKDLNINPQHIVAVSEPTYQESEDCVAAVIHTVSGRIFHVEDEYSEVITKWRAL